MLTIRRLALAAAMLLVIAAGVLFLGTMIREQYSLNTGVISRSVSVLGIVVHSEQRVTKVTGEFAACGIAEQQPDRLFGMKHHGLFERVYQNTRGGRIYSQFYEVILYFEVKQWPIERRREFLLSMLDACRRDVDLEPMVLELISK